MDVIDLAQRATRTINVIVEPISFILTSRKRTKSFQFASLS